jgi:broad specificity phosphatase PhoE
MDQQQLHEKLEQLHDELDKVECPDSNQREILEKVASDIQDLLARQAEGAEHYRDLGERLKGAVAQLEASHPEATLRMRQVIDQLAYMGI